MSTLDDERSVVIGLTLAEQHLRRRASRVPQRLAESVSVDDWLVVTPRELTDAPVREV